MCQSHKARPPPATTAPGRRVGLGKGDEVKDTGELFCVHKSRARATGASPRPNVWPLGSQGRGRRSLVPSCSGTTQGPCLWAGGAAPCGLSCPDRGQVQSGHSVPQAGLCGVQTAKLSRGPPAKQGRQTRPGDTPGLEPLVPTDAWAVWPPSLSHRPRQGRREPWRPLALAESRPLRRAEAPAEMGPRPRRDPNPATPASRSASLDLEFSLLNA